MSTVRATLSCVLTATQIRRVRGLEQHIAPDRARLGPYIAHAHLPAAETFTDPVAHILDDQRGRRGRSHVPSRGVDDRGVSRVHERRRLVSDFLWQSERFHAAPSREECG